MAGRARPGIGCTSAASTKKLEQSIRLSVLTPFVTVGLAVPDGFRGNKLLFLAVDLLMFPFGNITFSYLISYTHLTPQPSPPLPSPPLPSPLLPAL
jgi:hypothetical protein